MVLQIHKVKLLQLCSLHQMDQQGTTVLATIKGHIDTLSKYSKIIKMRLYVVIMAQVYQKMV